MTRTLMGLLAVAVTVSATTAHADDWRRGRHHGHRARPVQHDCGPRPTMAPAGTTFAHGQYQLQSTQRWVPGQPQQVWVPGQCWGGRHRQRCTQGSYQWVTGPGHYETVQQWVWVPATQNQGYGGQYAAQYGAQYGGQYGAQYGGQYGAQYDAQYGGSGGFTYAESTADGSLQVGVSFGASNF